MILQRYPIYLSQLVTSYHHAQHSPLNTKQTTAKLRGKTFRSLPKLEELINSDKCFLPKPPSLHPALAWIFLIYGSGEKY